MKILFRIPIALRLFLFVLFTTLLITTASLVGQHYQMQKNFAHYVADVEMQKLDHLIQNLESIYSQYGDWGDAIQAQIELVEGQPDPADYDHLSHWWLRRQYDIALQQLMFFKEQATQQMMDKKSYKTPSALLKEVEYLNLKHNLPSEYYPFEGLSFPLKDSLNWNQGHPPILNDQELDFSSDIEFKKQAQNLVTSDPQQFDSWIKSHHNFVFMPDHLGLSPRLALYDAKWQFIVGEPSSANEVSYRALKVNNEVVGYLGLKATLEQKDTMSINFFKNQQRYLWSIYALAVISSLIISLLLAQYFKRPIQSLLIATQELSQGHYQYQVYINRNDELGDLSKNVNQLAKILYQHEQSRQQWMADTSHELKTPLSVLQAQIEAMQDGIRQATPEHLASMQRQVQSLKKLIQDLSDISQADAQQLTNYPNDVEVWQIVLQEIEQFRLKFEQSRLTIQVEGVDAIAYIDADRFKQVIGNLLQNSIRYTEAGGVVHIHSEIRQKQWFLYVDDSPLGVTDEQLAHLGERFYRVDDSRTRSTGGTGLGLALCCRIAKILGGDLHFTHSPLGGLRCCLRLPIK